jgi:succinate dehydrogenase/fumarate reductase flavoprotein subunit
MFYSSGHLPNNTGKVGTATTFPHAAYKNETDAGKSAGSPDFSYEEPNVNTTTVTINGHAYPVISVNTVVVGTGAASLNAAVQLDRLGVKDLLIVTEAVGGGTSCNTGSDKQTYYKLSVAGGGADSPQEMAHSLFDGGAMHGDLALIEATLSAQGFFHLVSLGVPFPHDRYGSFVGYKTDHDPRQRATSAGPKTSMLMFEKLLDEARRRQLAIRESVEVIGVLTRDGESAGLVCLDTTQLDAPGHGLFLINATNVVFGTGGPAVIYQDSVYPTVHTGSTGIALEAGVPGQNLTEWQYGLASTKFRWNVSGTYQQVIPRYISTDQDGGDAQEFLNPFFDSMTTLTTDIFLKGYQWPFDPRKVRNYGSSIVDILVYNETVVRGRRVFMDFRANPSNAGNAALAPFSFDVLGDEARKYLENSHALQDTPIARLHHMNPLAISLYAEHGIDLWTEPLEVAVCAQHNNGGLKGNLWWESDVRHFFPVGEANGSHGVYRPGGSALNSGQCGSLRAAQFIAARYTEAPPAPEAFAAAVSAQVAAKQGQIDGIVTDTPGNCNDILAYRRRLQARMTAYGAYIRDAGKIALALDEARAQLAEWDTVKASPDALHLALKNRDAMVTQIAYLSAMAEAMRRGGVSRGSYMVMHPDGELPCDALGDAFRFVLGDDPLKEEICETVVNPDGTVTHSWVPRRPIPQDDGWYENIWAAYREDQVIR